MTADDALQAALTQYLSDDATLLGISPGGVWYEQAASEAPLPYTTWEWHHATRELTFGTVAANIFFVRVKGFWTDAGGQNFATVAAIKSRFSYLLDGIETSDANRIKAALSAYLNTNGFQCTLCRMKYPIPPHGEPLGENETHERYSSGFLFEIHIQAA